MPNRNICIITARGGSKRIPRKNIKDFIGDPIIAYPIRAALESALFDTVMVSTDDEEISEVARRLGADVPFLRSEKTSDDFATTADVLLEVLNEYENRGSRFEYACCCYPTSPFLTGQKLKDAYNFLLERKADSIFPVCEYSTPIFRALTLGERDLVRFVWPENEAKRSQDLPSAFFDTGQFYFFQIQSFLRSGRLVTDNSIGLPVSAGECQDIDNEADWKLAELKYKIWAGL